MKFQCILNSSGCLLLAFLFINSVPTIEADDINNTRFSKYTSATGYRCLVELGTEANCPRYIHLATAPAQRTFHYDPDMLPEVAEVIFALRIKHANAGKAFIINLSGNYLLKFTEDRIYILDTYTKNSDVYEYQSTTPNITLGLVISKGLPRNYKGIIIKEDAHGKLYDYAALRSDNISTDETMLSETLSHPFYEVTGQDGGEDEVTISKAMAFYHEVPSHSHSRHVRCVKESMGILEQIQEILGSRSLVCRPEAASGIRSANHQSAAEMTLDQPLVEAPVKTSKYPERLGYRLEKHWDLNDENPVAVLAAANFCQVSVMTILLGKRRQERALDLENCSHSAQLMVGLYTAFGLDFNDIYQIVENVKKTHDIPASYFPNGKYPPKKEGHIELLVSLIFANIDQAAALLQEAAALEGEAAGASLFVERHAESQAGGESAAAERRVEVFTLNGQQFIPEPNVVKVVKQISPKKFKIVVISGDKYTTEVIYLGDKEQRSNINIDNTISDYIKTMENWVDQIKKKLRQSSRDTRFNYRQNRDIALTIISILGKWKNFQNLVISTVYHNDFLIGISTGKIDGVTYYPEHEIVTPATLFGDNGSNREQLTFLRSEVLKYLLSKGLIDKSELVQISKESTGHDEL